MTKAHRYKDDTVAAFKARSDADNDKFVSPLIRYKEKLQINKMKMTWR